jgi:small multidrug resistance pump
MEWVYLLLAILFEVLGTTLLKLAQGVSKIHYFILAMGGYVCCFLFLSLSLRKIDLSVAYAIWAGLGIAVISVIGIVVYNEGITSVKLISLALIVFGIVGLKIDTDYQREDLALRENASVIEVEEQDNRDETLLDTNESKSPIS